ncbi:UDP-galactopyranose mutase [Bacteroidia bacterium]|nr:UDP-galactopyranose mutase [Bacteroidia bacterium]
MEKIAVIGAGVSGLSIAQLLKDKYSVKLFEKASRPGGLIKCEIVDGNLYHTVGGHVFNSKYPAVLDWFWQFFDRENEFSKTPRNASIALDNSRMVGYPIENHAYMLEEKTTKAFIQDLLTLSKQTGSAPDNFEEFLRTRFGNTLYDLYFQPYNEKVWRRNLKQVPLSWLEGKLPMPTIEEMIYNNFNHAKEENMVHSSFYYPKQNGSQFIANRLAENLDIAYDQDITSIVKKDIKWIVNGETFDKVIFCGNIKDFPNIFKNSLNTASFVKPIEALESHGTTSVLCEIDTNPYSWIYLPNRAYSSHRIICTGNFAMSNNNGTKLTGTIEFTDYISRDEITTNLAKMPFTPKHIAHQYTEYTYPIQEKTTKDLIHELKQAVAKEQVFLLGRFAEWEYYNMDAAMKAAMDLATRIEKNKLR